MVAIEFAEFARVGRKQLASGSRGLTLTFSHPGSAQPTNPGTIVIMYRLYTVGFFLNPWIGSIIREIVNAKFWIPVSTL